MNDLINSIRRKSAVKSIRELYPIPAGKREPVSGSQAAQAAKKYLEFGESMDLFSITKINPKRLKKDDLIVLVMENNSRYHGVVQWAPKGADHLDCNQMFTSRYRLRFRCTSRTELIEGHKAVVFEYEKIIRIRKTTSPYDKGNNK